MTDDETLLAAARHRDQMQRDPDAWLWWTFWQVVLAPNGESIGLVDFKGPPGREGGVTIGCSFAPAHWSHGYATEAVKALVAWALGDSSVRFVAAETDTENLRAHHVLRKLGFESAQGAAGKLMGACRDVDDLFAWRLVRPGDSSPRT